MGSEAVNDRTGGHVNLAGTLPDQATHIPLRIILHISAPSTGSSNIVPPGPPRYRLVPSLLCLGSCIIVPIRVVENGSPWQRAQSLNSPMPGWQ